MTNKHVNDSGCEEFCDYEETREIFETNAQRRNFFWTSYQNGPPKTTTPSPTTLPLANRSDDSSYSSGKSQTIIHPNKINLPSPRSQWRKYE